MNKFFISKKNIKKLVVLTFCISLLFSYKFTSIWLLILTGCLLTFKKNKVPLKDSLSNTVDIMVSPLSGEVLSIETNEKETRCMIRVAPYKNFGFYFPFSAVIGKIEEKGSKKVNSLLSNIKVDSLSLHTEIEFQNKLNVNLSIYIYHNLFSLKPHIWIKTGDKGRVSSNFGFMPFGGVVEIVTSNKCDQLVEIGEKVFAGSTPLVGFKGK